jgi:hypothetical protein
MKISKLLPIIGGVAFLLILAAKMWPIAVILGLTIVGVAFYRQFKVNAKHRVEDIRDQLDSETRALYLGIYRAMSEFEGTLESAKSKPSLWEIAAVAVDELTPIKQAINRGVLLRSELKKNLKEYRKLEYETDKIQERQGTDALSAVDDEQTALIRRAEATINSIDQQIQICTDAIVLMKANFNRVKLEEVVESNEKDDLRKSLSELKALGQTLNEVEELSNDLGKSSVS